ncbi:serine/threonine protein phosphatase [Nonlabens spongiae]|uniref:Serine/threonine protein phosphatase n=1 Tax=Nonlabens spongiae TaxID=331648 RepID=A0A1W6MKZ4_9FLAO|nr:metallophosphoesterase family protein [Nonlabens spongiae]ARN78139.1 serine/threonine protein phosphatase [Nonlabens spongiae]
MRTIVIGDIHGGYKALVQLMERVAPTNADQLIFLGDYVDGWSESYEVIDYLISLSSSLSRKRNNVNEAKPIFLRGNHDELVLNYFTQEDENEMWLYHGGKSTVKSYQNRPPEKIQEHINFLKNGLVNYYEKDGNGFFHAGFHNLKGPAHEYYETMSYWDRSLWEMALCMDSNIAKDDLRYPNRLKLYNEIFIGHTPTDRLGKHVPINAANVWNVDTAAAYKGPLTALCVEDKTIWQSDPVHTFYPDEKGRN